MEGDKTMNPFRSFVENSGPIAAISGGTLAGSYAKTLVSPTDEATFYKGAAVLGVVSVVAGITYAGRSIFNYFRGQ